MCRIVFCRKDGESIMPIKDYSRYPKNWKEISLSIRERDEWCCKFCGAENGKPNPATGSIVVLTVAHLGTVHADGTAGDPHDKMDVRDENLAGLCQRCHLNYDRDEHIENARKTRIRKRQEAHDAAGQRVLMEAPVELICHL